MRPDGNRLSLHQGAGLDIDEGAATGGQHHALVLEYPGNDAGFPGAEFGLAALLEDFRDRHLRGLLDLFVAIEKMPAEAGCQATADRRLAGAHHAHQHQRLAAEALDKLLGAGLPQCRVGSVQGAFPKCCRYQPAAVRPVKNLRHQPTSAICLIEMKPFAGTLRQIHLMDLACRP